MKAMEELLQFASFLSASYGAVLATIAVKPSPEEVLARIRKNGGHDFFGGDFDDLVSGLSKQSLNATRAAFSAALSAIFQFLAYVS